MANGMLIGGDVSLMHKSWYRLLRKELDRRRRLKRKHQRDTRKEDDSGLNLPMELVEKIIALVPFPDVFKGRVLSRSWRRKFSLASQPVQPVQSPFLQELSTTASRWPTFSPVLVSSDGDLLGYNHTTFNWEKVVMSAYIPMNRFHSDRVSGRKVEFGGSLLCMYDRNMPFYDMGRALFVFFVANIQTGSWKTTLCPLESIESHDPRVLLINESGSEDYKLVVYDSHERRSRNDQMFPFGFRVETHVFDSASRTWTSKSSEYVRDEVASGLSSYSTYLDGNMYFMGPRERGYCESVQDLILPDVVRLYKCNLEESVWMVSPSSVLLTNKRFSMGGVFLCGSKLMLITIYEEPELETNVEADYNGNVSREGEYIKNLSLRFRACIYNVCLETLEIEEVSRSPFNIFRGPDRSLASDEGHVYICSWYRGSKLKVEVVGYNVSQQSWEHLPSPPTDIRRGAAPWAMSAYAPGQNPFALA